MVRKRQKKRARAKRKDQKTIIILFILLSGSLVLISLGLYLSNSPSQTTAPAYEEIYAVTSDFGKALSRIDTAIYESLYREGIPESNIIFTDVKPNQRGGYYWNFTELSVHVADPSSALHLVKIIKARLDQLKPQISYKSEKINNREIVYHVFTLDLNTHRIRLIYGGHRKTYPESFPKVALIIDDLGYDLRMAFSFFELDLPLSFSVLPIAPHTQDIVHEAHKRGRELILHLPMEPRNYPSLNPGPGALLTAMNEREIRHTITDHLKRVAGSRGVNHHMGSYFTERRDKMTVVMEELKRRKLFYIDSRTTTKTVALELARTMGVPTVRRHVFLDNEISPKSIRFQMERLLGMARHRGAAVGIGHPHEETLDTLKRYMPRLKNDVKVVPVSHLVS